MTRDQFDAFCGTLPKSTHVIQWGGASVWKIGGKIFAICHHRADASGGKISFKCSDLSYSLLIEVPGILPAPYLARAKWVQLDQADALSNEDIKAYLANAHKLIAANLPRKLQAELGLA